MVTIGGLLADPKYPEKLILQKLFCAFTSCSREDLRSKMDEEMDADLQKKMIDAYTMYVRDKKPLEYLLGYVEFFWTKFIVSGATLIPRPETEYMITAVTEYISSKPKAQSWKPENNLLLDIGTGCGVLWISVLLQNPDYFSDAIFTDFYENALEIAFSNFELIMKNEKWKINVSFLHSDLLDFLVHGKSEKSSTLKDPPSFEIKEDTNVVLVANLPYIPEQTFEENVADNVKNREPKLAFVGGDDGLDYYRIMLDQIIQLQDTRSREQKPVTWNLLPVTMFLEMMTRQVDVLRQEFDQYFVFEEVKTFHFNIRIVKACMK